MREEEWIRMSKRQSLLSAYRALVVTFMISIEKPYAPGDKTGPRMQEGLMNASGTPTFAAHFCASGSAKICGLHNLVFLPMC